MMSLKLRMARSSKGKRSQVEASCDRSHSNARQELLAAVAVTAEEAVHGQFAACEGRSTSGDGGNGEQGGEDDGFHGHSPRLRVCVAFCVWVRMGPGVGASESRYARLTCRAEISSSFGIDSNRL